MKQNKIYSLLLCLIFFGCSQDVDKKKASIKIMTHDSFSISQDVVKKFEEMHNTKMIFLKSGDAGEALNKAILSKNNPMADIFYGVDNTFLSRAINEDVFISYSPINLKNIDKKLKLDKTNKLIPMDYGDVCLNYDIKWFENNNKKPPLMLEDLILSEYKSLTVVQNPATSSPGLAFLLTTIKRFGQNKYIEFWQKLLTNDLLIVNGWQEAYWKNFTAASNGKRPIVVSYATSPAAEVFFAEPKTNKAITKAVIEHGSSFRQIEFAGILKNTKNLKLAKKTMDFLLSKTFQEDIALQMFMLPVNKDVLLPQIFVEHVKISNKPSFLEPELINEKREIWIQEWTHKILQ